jgi:hypothetical protein
MREPGGGEVRGEEEKKDRWKGGGPHLCTTYKQPVQVTSTIFTSSLVVHGSSE